MRFAHVTGMLLGDAAIGYRIEVTLDTRSQVTTVRDEAVASLMWHAGEPDAQWTVDQLTQETIGTTLAELGWEAISEVEAEEQERVGPPVVVYLVRQV